MSTGAGTRFQNVDAMRGIASLAVAWFHFTCGNVAFLAAGPLKSSGQFGWAGVEMFFVISGFIIPYTLYRGEYRFTRFPRFLAKRLVRLDPPYLAAIGIIITIGILGSYAPGFQGAQFSVTARQLAVHLGYMNAFFGETWLNPVFWTLAIEFQYYLLIGAVFPLLVHKRVTVRFGAFAGLAAVVFIGVSDRFVLHYLPLFLLGVSVFYLRCGLLDQKYLPPVVAALSTIVFFRLGFVVSIVGCLSVVLLILERIRYPRLLVGAGAISYSLYLLHVPFGGRVINLSLRLPNSPVVKAGALLTAMTVSIAASCVLYFLVERPAQRWSGRISLKPPTRSDQPILPAVAVEN